MDRIAVIVVAAGSGTRMGGGQDALPKQFMELCGVPILVRTVQKFKELLPGSDITVVLSAHYIPLWDEMCRRWNIDDISVCEGGATRFESVRNAVEKLPDCDWVMVHDGVRPLFTARMLSALMEGVRKTGAAIPVVEAVDSLRLVAGDDSQPLDRAAVRAVQTPQVFRTEILRRAYGQPYDPLFTDDASVVEALGVKVALCEGERSNIKITTPEDMALAAALLANK